jgi:hypothetical protein
MSFFLAGSMASVSNVDGCSNATCLQIELPLYLPENTNVNGREARIKLGFSRRAPKKRT